MSSAGNLPEMGTVEISFGANPGNADSAVVPVEIVDQDFNIAWQGTTALYPPATVDLKAGPYVVRASMPSGQLATTQVQVLGGETSTAVIRPERQSPNESLGWAYYLQQTPLQSGWKDPALAAITRSGAAEPAAIPFLEQPVVTYWEHEPHGQWRFAQPWQLGLNITAMDIREGDRSALLGLQIYGSNARQVWAQVIWQGYSTFTALPINQQNIHLLVLADDPHDQDPRPFRVLIGGAQPDSDALMSYLASGDFESARRVGNVWFDKAERMLQQKVFDPIGAALAGYFLLKTGELDRLHDWTYNLTHMFDWLPDGPIILAWHILSSTRNEAEARKYLLEAEGRGIPLYTQGLRFLYDGLNLLDHRARGSDPEVAQALERVRPYAAAATWSSPVTTFSGPEPDKPSILQEELIAGGASGAGVLAMQPA